ncbi:hypothetical protein V7149_07305 [Bacillus sp. JJ1503]|uniref:vWA domain-containing protein n=1 Tax=Bacillus sp. JJ1503 TaxID=3122956 RepID=UPI003000557A
MKLKYIALIFLSLFFVVAGCSSVETNDKEKDPKPSADEKQKEEEKQAVKIEYPAAATEAVEIVHQPIGVKLEGMYSDDRPNKEDVDIDNLMSEFGVEELGNEEIYNGLVHWFGLDYTEVNDALAKYEPDFGELDITKEKKKIKNIAVHIDSSGSMAAAVPGGEKMALAKGVINRFASSLPSDSIISLRAYGHKGTGKNEDKKMSCSSTEVMYEANTFNETEFNEALNKFKPSGWTPLASSIKASYEDLKVKAGEDTENILFIVSDGIETCDGNPIEEAKKLAESDLKVKVYIIGFNVDDAGQKQLKDTAAASNGEYYTVNSKVELENTFKKLMEEAVNTIAKNNQKAVNGINVNFRTADLREQLRGIESSFMKVVNLENEVIREALSKLEAEGKIESTDVDEIQDKLKARYDVLDVYAKNLVDQGMEKINNKREELFSIINGS